MKPRCTIIICFPPRKAGGARALKSLSSPSLVPWGRGIGVRTRQASRGDLSRKVHGFAQFVLSEVSVDRRACSARRRSASARSLRDSP